LRIRGCVPGVRLHGWDAAAVSQDAPVSEDAADISQDAQGSTRVKNPGRGRDIQWFRLRCGLLQRTPATRLRSIVCLDARLRQT
jgi:hypothetical protein